MSLMDDGGDTKEDIRVPENEVGKEITTRFQNDEGIMVTILFAMGEEAAVAVKNLVESKK